MGIDRDFGWAFAKSQAAAGMALPCKGTALLSVKDGDKPTAADVAHRLLRLGFQLQATHGTAMYLKEHGCEVTTVNKVKEGRPHIVDHIKNQDVQLVINTIGTTLSEEDSSPIRRESLYAGIPYFTTMQGARAAVMGIEATLTHSLTVQTLQEYHPA